MHGINKSDKSNKGRENHNRRIITLQTQQITCFEMKSTPGGVWRAPDPLASSSNHNQIYNELWTKCVAHTLEFYDYTFDEHFQGEPITAFLPRRDINEYLLGRVTKGHPTFFEEYFVFDTQVERVQETTNKDKGSFKVTTRNLVTGEVNTQLFDRCIWAAGQNCEASIPKSLQDVFHGTGRFSKADVPSTIIDDHKESKEPKPDGADFCLLHSVETKRIQEQCNGRKVLLIGGGFSAEDLALQCVKWGATHVHVATRQDDAEVTWTSQWPGNKVTVHAEKAVESVNTDGEIILTTVEAIWPIGYKKTHRLSDNKVVLRGINIVIFCTGYNPNLNMLDLALRPQSDQLPGFTMGDHPSLYIEDFDWSTWKMTKKNAAYEYTGDIPAGQKRMIYAGSIHPDMCRGVFYENPHMMYLCENGAESPLFSLDVSAWLLCSYLTGYAAMPSVEELKALSMEEFLDKMQRPIFRFQMDEAYFEILTTKREYWGLSTNSDDDDSADMDDDEENKDDDEENNDSRSDPDVDAYQVYMIQLLCKIMKEGKHPGPSLGTYEKLNKTGRRLKEFMDSAYDMRADIETDYPDDWKWRTFRDADEAELVFSIHTGTKGRTLRRRWMDAEEGNLTSIRNGVL